MASLLQIDWERILDRFGWPTLIVLALAIFLRAVIWPIIKAKLEAGDRAQARVTELLENQVLKADARIERADRVHEELFEEIKEAMGQSARESRRQADLLEELLRRQPRQ